MTNRTRTDPRAPDEERSRSRVPPHDLEAEEASLGAALLSLDAADTIVDRLRPEDYYSPPHRHIFAAIRDVRSHGRPVDPVTVGDALRNAGLLDDVGGTGRVHELMNQTPAISNVAQYARIVRDHSRLRRLLYASADIADAAYNGGDPAEAVAKAQDALVQLSLEGTGGEQSSTLDVADIEALLATDLEVEEGVILTRSDGTALLYAGKMHVFQAEPSSGKSWVALAAVKEVLDVGGAAVFLDYEDTPQSVVKRLLLLGADPDAVGERFKYARPIGKHGPSEKLQLDRLLDDVNPDLVVIDGVGESLSRNGLSENDADDFLQWSNLLPRPIAARGAAVLMIDHVVKDPESRGRWARGTGAKLAAVDGASYQIKVISSFSREKSGAIKLVIAKDRPGGVGAIGETAAVISIESHGRGEAVRLTIEADSSKLATTDPFRPTHIMERVSREIEDSTVPLTAARIRDVVHGEPKYVSEAITRLVKEGFLEESGRGKTATFRSVRRFRAAHYEEEDGPPPEETPPPAATLFDEPDWIHESRRDYLDALSTDPTI